MNGTTRIVAALGVLLLAGASGPAWSQSGVDLGNITVHGGRIWTAAVPPPVVTGFTADEASAIEKTVVEVFRYDLRFTERFRFVDNERLLLEARDNDETLGHVNYVTWSRLGAQILIKSGIRRDPKGLVAQFELHSFEEGGGAMVKGIEVGPTSRDNLRRVVHKFSDVVIERFVGMSLASTKIAFVRRTGRVKEVYTIDYDGHESSLKQISSDNNIAEFPAWSPDGREIAYTSFKLGDADTFSFNRYTGRVTPISTYGGIDTCARWRPDGKMLVLALSRDWNTELYTVRPDGKGHVRLTNRTDSIETEPTYTPDDRHIVFTTDRGGRPRLAIMPAEGGEVRTIYSGGFNCGSPDVSPDGRKIAFVIVGSRDSYICLVNLDGSGAVRLTDSPWFCESPSWSPDGKWVLFSARRGDEAMQLYRLRYRSESDPAPPGVTDKIERVTYLPGENLSPAWSPLLKD